MRSAERGWTTVIHNSGNLLSVAGSTTNARADWRRDNGGLDFVFLAQLIADATAEIAAPTDDTAAFCRKRRDGGMEGRRKSVTMSRHPSMFPLVVHLLSSAATFDALPFSGYGSCSTQRMATLSPPSTPPKATRAHPKRRAHDRRWRQSAWALRLVGEQHSPDVETGRCGRVSRGGSNPWPSHAPMLRVRIARKGTKRECQWHPQR